MKKLILSSLLMAICIFALPTEATKKRMVLFPWQTRPVTTTTTTTVNTNSIKEATSSNAITTIDTDIAANCSARQFKITAYYMPLEWQSKYLHGSFEADIKMNWGNATSASGRPVFLGTVAAPKVYPFGTIVHIPWLGYGSVEDRWWAIVTQWETDYIDIRLGKWDGWLYNAMQRWVRWVKWYICPPDTVSDDKIWRDLAWFLAQPESIDSKMGKISLEYWQKWTYVSKLQSWLSELGYLSNYKDGTFDTATEDAVCNFQIENINLPSDDPYCGYYGVKTRAKMVQLMVK